ncbi:sorbitol dehydrogenase [Marinobacterium nitratireducens]|uniref:Sorbitol dehydrogenase n=1 Tax=Marinobacterium nitratireducens TaxID=518897 RepID=A0A917ZPJ1_9GAMM|nr:zinc-binding dehydrogenase [Marinobacterium nitratireducens]GGO88876.1 sorbitol dehydrogenase [Marinobacterium nitratireducens]
METMKAAVLHGNRDLRVIDIPRPGADDNSVLVRVSSVGVCGTDLHTYKLGMFKEMCLPQEQGLLFGHEFAGEVVEIGCEAGIEDLHPGDRVTGIAIGAYAEYCNVPPLIGDKPLIIKLPENVSFEEAATVEPLTVSLVAVQRAGLKGGERVLITGAGMIGLGCVQVIKALYPDCEVIVSDVADKRLEMAREFGAERTINVRDEDLVGNLKALTGEEFVLYGTGTTGHIDVAIEASGLAGPLNQCLEVLRPGTGRLVGVALYEEKPEVDFNQIVSKNLSVTGTLGYSQETMEQAMNLIAEGRVDRKPLITHRYKLAEASEAFEAQINTTQTLKAIIEP